ncbi:hypothetical protein [Bartonella rattaustraliani]|nr:hypothetical protein [Bartonella rattaustraliani]
MKEVSYCRRSFQKNGGRGMPDEVLGKNIRVECWRLRRNTGKNIEVEHWR